MQAIRPSESSSTPKWRLAERPAHRPALRFHRIFVPACASLADLDRLYRSLSTRLGINFKGKYKFCIKDLRSL